WPTFKGQTSPVRASNSWRSWRPYFGPSLRRARRAWRTLIVSHHRVAYRVSYCPRPWRVKRWGGYLPLRGAQELERRVHHPPPVAVQPQHAFDRQARPQGEAGDRPPTQPQDRQLARTVVQLDLQGVEPMHGADRDAPDHPG